MQAEDWLQDAFVKVFKNIESFGFKGAFEGWVRRILINTILKSLKKQRPIINSELVENSNLLIRSSALSRLGEEEMLTLINNLPEGYKIVFNLHVLDGYAHKEIAELLNIKESTSRSQLTKARKMLQEQITDLQKVSL